MRTSEKPDHEPLGRSFSARLLRWPSSQTAGNARVINFGRAAQISLTVLILLGTTAFARAAGELATNQTIFPPPLDSYGDAQLTNIWDVLTNRVRKEPFNLWASIVFVLAIIHTFLTHRFLRWSHLVEEHYRERARKNAVLSPSNGPAPEPTCIPARVLHFLGEVEAVFGIWVIPLFALMAARLSWHQAVVYLDNPTSYIEPVFVVVIMIIASTRPIIRLAEQALHSVARLGGGGPGAWWLAILTIGPVLGSFITEPAAMTISALLLGRQFYALKPDSRLAYATLGLLFVDISVGGVLTHFAAPPVLMVAGRWRWDTPYMFRHFGWIALTGMAISNCAYYLVLRKSIARLPSQPNGGEESTPVSAAIPTWVTICNLLFLAWTVFNGHYPILVVGGFLFFIAFVEVTADYQSELQVRSPILVGFFLAGLVIHGGLQQWWIEPVLRRLNELPLMLGSIALTAFNDNAAVTYLASMVPDLSDRMKFAVVAGAVVGGGLTVIANAPNPAGQSLLGKYFKDGIAPLYLLLGALPATIVLFLCFHFLG